MEYKLSEIKAREIIPGYHGKLIHTENMSLVFWEVEKGAEVPQHAHIHEQILKVMEGSFEFTVAGKTKVYSRDELVVIPANISHGGKAITACKLMDIFCPTREDYK